MCFSVFVSLITNANVIEQFKEGLNNQMQYREET